MSDASTHVPVAVGDGVIYIDATVLDEVPARSSGEQLTDSRFTPPSITNPADMAPVMAQVSEIGRLAWQALEKVAPKKATVEFGIEVAVETGALVGMLAKGSGKANLKITLEWEAEKPANPAPPTPPAT